jgi:uncharacterized membrane protein
MTDEHLQNNEESSNDKNEFKIPEEEIVPDELKAIIENSEISDTNKKIIVRAFAKMSINKLSFIGPIPPPNILKGYNEVVKDGAERILAMAENQSNHRIQLETHAIKEELKQSRLGQLFGFILGVLGLGLATTLALLGHDTIAGIFGTTTIVGLVTVFVLGKKAQQKDLSDKE